MKFHSENSFLSKGSTQIPNGEFVACAIAPSSHVDLVLVGEHELAPMGIVPCQAGQTVSAIRDPSNVTSRFQANDGGLTEDFVGTSTPGEKLVLLLYEKCDRVDIRPGPRAPLVVGARVPSSKILIGAASPALALRVPFSGRRQCAFYIRCDSSVNAKDIGYQVRGIKYSDRRAGKATGPAGPFEAEGALKTWWNGAAAAPVSSIGASTMQLAAAFYVGGGGDLQEAFDELQLHIWGATAFATSDILVMAEAIGENVI